MIDQIDAIRAAIVKHWHEASSEFRSAAIFDLDGDEQVEEFLKWQAAHETFSDEWLDEFFMPFPSVIVRIQGGAVILMREPAIRGLRADPGVPVPDNEDTTFEDGPTSMSFRFVIAFPFAEADGFVVTNGYLHGHMLNQNGEAVFRSGHASLCIVDGTGSVGKSFYWDDLLTRNREWTDECTGVVRGNLMMSIRRLWWALQPSNWIVIKSPELARPISRSAIPYAHERERYLILSQRAIERVFRLPNPNNTGRTLKVGHRRRACWHTLKHERFAERRGERIYVKGCWVGPEEVVVGGERYRVLLDSPGYNPDDLPDLPPDAIELPPA